MAAEEKDAEVVDGVVEPEAEVSTALVVPDPLTGEVLVLGEVGPDALAQAMLNAQTRRDQLREAEDLVSEELLRRMDADLSWTQRVPVPGEDGRQFEIKGASPDAGTTSYDVDVLEAELLPLVEQGVLSQEAYEGVIKRTVVVTIDEHDTARLEAFAKSLGAKVAVSQSAPVGAVNKLAKLNNEAVDAAIEQAKRFNKTNRRATVKIKDKKNERRR